MHNETRKAVWEAIERAQAANAQDLEWRTTTVGTAIATLLSAAATLALYPHDSAALEAAQKVETTLYG